MRILRRIFVLIAIVVAIVVLTTQWILPVAESIETVRKPPIGSWLVPRELTDHSIENTAGRRLLYFGYQFEIPWSDIGETQTKLYPNMVVLTFHSGLKMMVAASPPKLWLGELFGKSKITEARVEQTFGTHSDYDFLATLYTFTPANMRLWALSRRRHYRENFMLHLKSLAVLNEGQHGFFYIGNAMFKGFQQDDPQAWPPRYQPKSRSTVFVQLFSAEGNLYVTLFQNNYKNSTGVTQAEVNRIIQSVHKI